MKRANSDKNREQDYLLEINCARTRMKLHIFGLGLIALLVIGYSVFCTINMKSQDAKHTKRYIKTYVQQLTDTIDLKVQGTARIMDSMTDTVAQGFSEGKLQNFTDRKRRLYDFSFIAYFDEQTGEQTVSGAHSLEPEHLKKFGHTESMREVLESGKCAAGIFEDSVVFAKNVFAKGEKIGTLWGGIKAEVFRKMFGTSVFQDGDSVSYIMEEDGKIFLASNEENEGENIAVLLENDENTRQNIRTMNHDIACGKSGAYQFYADGKRKCYLAYAVSQTEGWSIATAVPADLFTGFSDSYVAKMFGSQLAALILFAGIFALLFRTYTENRKRIERLAFYDEITGGMNRIKFRMKYQELCRMQKADQYTLVLMDCADFRLLNKALGFRTGDKMLKHFYAVIHSALHTEKGEFAARIEMDHFFLCLCEKDPEVIARRLDWITKEINSSKNGAFCDYRVSFWLGACSIEENDIEIKVLQDQVRTVIKKLGRQDMDRLVFYNQKFAEKIQRERDLETQFDAALLNGEFQVYYQPKVNFRTKEIVGAEAFVRWIHPVKGVISPAEFIPILESNGKIRTLDCYVFEHVCCWLKKQKEENRRLIPVSVNLSRIHFVNDNFLLDFVRIADQYQVSRKLIEFEVTESVFLHESQINKIRDGLSMMHHCGFQCSLDDFGVGYSSLALLCELDIDVLKLDCSFFLKLDSKKARDVIASVVSIAEKLDIRIVVEGIETESQIQYLETVNCDTVQGYFFSKPLPEQDFEAWEDEFYRRMGSYFDSRKDANV